MTVRETMSTYDDKQVDKLLKRSFSGKQTLSDGFEDRVMSTIHRQESKSRQNKAVMIAMLVYWTIASLVGAWLLLGGSASEGSVSTSNTLILLPVLALVVIGLTFIVRQASFRISELFLETLR